MALVCVCECEFTRGRASRGERGRQCVCVWGETERKESAQPGTGPGERRQHGFVSREERPAVCGLDGKSTAEHAHDPPHQPRHPW